MTNDLLREASDPATPGERLRELWHATVRGEQNELTPEGQRALFAMMSNPSLPVDLLRGLLLTHSEEAWLNPATPLLLQSDPDPDFAEAACRLLAHVATGDSYLAHPAVRSEVIRAAQAGDLATAVRRWAQLHDGTLRGRVLARHLAGLFGLPWPEEAP